MSKKNFKKQTYFNPAYWIGVGLSAARDNRSTLLDSSKYKKSIRAGYEADNRRNISKKFI